MPPVPAARPLPPAPPCCASLCWPSCACRSPTVSGAAAVCRRRTSLCPPLPCTALARWWCAGCDSLCLCLPCPALLCATGAFNATCSLQNMNQWTLSDCGLTTKSNYIYAKHNVTIDISVRTRFCFCFCFVVVCVSLFFVTPCDECDVCDVCGVCVCQGHVNSVVTAGTAKYQVYEDDVSVPHCVC